MTLPFRPAPRHVPAVVLASLALAGPAAAAEDAPPLGTVRTLPVVTVSLNVGGTEKESKRVVYAPPPGWYVRSHTVEVKRTGPASYTVSTVPAGWNWSSAEAGNGGSKSAAAGTVSAPHVAFGGSLALEAEAAAAGRQRTNASHHALVVEATARGPGLWRGTGGIDLTVTAEMVYVGDRGVPEK